MNYNLLHKTFKHSLFNNKFSLEKYFLSSNLYAKYYVKVVDITEIRNKEIKLYSVENTFHTLNTCFNKRRKKRLNRFNFNLKPGRSLALKFFKFRNRFHKNLSFKSLLPTRKARTTFGTMRLFRLLKFMRLKNFGSFFFLRPNKGGFLLYSNAVFFLPKSHFKYALSIFFKTLNSRKTHKNITVLSKLFCKIKRYSLIPPIRFPYTKIQFSVRKMPRIRYNFRLSKKRKRRKQIAKFRMVIVYKKQIIWNRWRNKSKNPLDKSSVTPLRTDKSNPSVLFKGHLKKTVKLPYPKNPIKFKKKDNSEIVSGNSTVTSKIQGPIEGEDQEVYDIILKELESIKEITGWDDYSGKEITCELFSSEDEPVGFIEGKQRTIRRLTYREVRPKDHVESIPKDATSSKSSDQTAYMLKKKTNKK